MSTVNYLGLAALLMLISAPLLWRKVRRMNPHRETTELCAGASLTLGVFGIYLALVWILYPHSPF